MIDLQNAKRQLLEGEHTCVLKKGDSTYTSVQRGVRPLIEWLEAKADLTGFSAADRVVGRGAAFLYVLLGVKAVYARVISHAACEVLEEHGIAVEYDTAVRNIINRRGNGICPIEEAVLDITNAEEAYAAIKQKIKILSQIAEP